MKITDKDIVALQKIDVPYIQAAYIQAALDDIYSMPKSIHTGQIPCIIPPCHFDVVYAILVRELGNDPEFLEFFDSHIGAVANSSEATPIQLLYALTQTPPAVKQDDIDLELLVSKLQESMHYIDVVTYLDEDARNKVVTELFYRGMSVPGRVVKDMFPDLKGMDLADDAVHKLIRSGGWEESTPLDTMYTQYRGVRPAIMEVKSNTQKCTPMHPVTRNVSLPFEITHQDMLALKNSEKRYIHDAIKCVFEKSLTIPVDCIALDNDITTENVAYAILLRELGKVDGYVKLFETILVEQGIFSPVTVLYQSVYMDHGEKSLAFNGRFKIFADWLFKHRIFIDVLDSLGQTDRHMLIFELLESGVEIPERFLDEDFFTNGFKITMLDSISPSVIAKYWDVMDLELRHHLVDSFINAGRQVPDHIADSVSREQATELAQGERPQLLVLAPQIDVFGPRWALNIFYRSDNPKFVGRNFKHIRQHVNFTDYGAEVSVPFIDIAISSDFPSKKTILGGLFNQKCVRDYVHSSPVWSNLSRLYDGIGESLFEKLCRDLT